MESVYWKKWKNKFQKIYFIFHIWLLNWKKKNEKKLFLNLFWLKINLKNKNFRIDFLISNQKANFKKFFHFSILNEKFSKFVLFFNQKANYTFGTRIISIYAFQFIKKKKKNGTLGTRVHENLCNFNERNNWIVWSLKKHYYLGK